MSVLSNVLLFLALIGCALSLVHVRQEERLFYVELEKAKQTQLRLEQEYGQLSLEESTIATQARVERIAVQVLKMKTPTAKQVEILPVLTHLQ